ncbi:MAG: biotin/lipoyl-binding protein, partial [Saprospiraceae bacterium]
MNSIKSIFSLTVFSIVLLSCNDSKESLGTHKETEMPVEIVLAKADTNKAENSNTFVASGKLEAIKSATISSKFIGNVSHVFIREGQLVKEGQILLKLKSDGAVAQKNQLEAAVREAKAAMYDAQTNLDRYSILYKQQSAS